MSSRCVSPKDVLLKAYNKLKNSECGSYTVEYYRKNLFSVDTVHYKGYVNFFLNADSSFNNYFFRLNGQQSTLKYDSLYYQNNEVSRQYTVSNRLARNVSNYHCFIDIINYKNLLKYCSDTSYKIKIAGNQLINGKKCYNVQLSLNTGDEFAGDINIFIDKEKYSITSLQYAFYYQKETQFESITINNLVLNTHYKCTLNEIYYRQLADSIEKNFTCFQFSGEKKTLPSFNVFDTIPDFNLTSDSGGQTRLYDLKDSLIILDFWYISCYPCMKISPKLNEIQRKYGAIKVLSINNYDDKSKIISHRNKYDIKYEILIGSGEIASAFRIRGYPTVIIVNNKFQVLKIIEGYHDKILEEIEKVINAN